MSMTSILLAAVIWAALVSLALLTLSRYGHHDRDDTPPPPVRPAVRPGWQAPRAEGRR